MRNHELLKYAGLAAQLFATLGVAFFIGFKLDKKLHLRFPILTISLPLAALISLLYKVYLDSSKKNEE